MQSKLSPNLICTAVSPEIEGILKCLFGKTVVSGGYYDSDGNCSIEKERQENEEKDKERQEKEQKNLQEQKDLQQQKELKEKQGREEKIKEKKEQEERKQQEQQEKRQQEKRDNDKKEQVKKEQEKKEKDKKEQEKKEKDKKQQDKKEKDKKEIEEKAKQEQEQKRRQEMAAIEKEKEETKEILVDEVAVEVIDEADGMDIKIGILDLVDEAIKEKIENIQLTCDKKLEVSKNASNLLEQEIIALKRTITELQSTGKQTKEQMNGLKEENKLLEKISATIVSLWKTLSLPVPVYLLQSIIFNFIPLFYFIITVYLQKQKFWKFQNLHHQLTLKNYYFLCNYFFFSILLFNSSFLFFFSIFSFLFLLFYCTFTPSAFCFFLGK